MKPYIKINGKPFPFPKRGISPTVTTIVDAGRATNARVVGQRIGRDQYKLDNLMWPYLSAQQWSDMLKEFGKFDITVEFPDPVEMKWIKLRMYPGDRKGEPFMLGDDGMPTSYINCTCNVIDRGEDIL